MLIVHSIFSLGCSYSSPLMEQDSGSAQTSSIYVASHGWHAGIIVDARLVKATMTDLKKEFGNARFIEFGWGDKDFYQAKHFSIGITIKALLYPTASVLHVVGIPIDPEKYFYSSQIEAVPVTSAGLAKMLNFINRAFMRDKRGDIMQLGKGFYRAFGKYHAFNTCNTWIIEALNQAGLPRRAMPTLTAAGVIEQVRLYKQSRVTGMAAVPVD